MVRVYKSVGAVRVYNVRNAIVIALAALALLLGLGFLIGYFTRGSGTTASAATTTRIVRVSDPTPAPKPAPAPRGYRNGFKAGVSAVLGNPHAFSSGGYVVRLVPGQSGPLTIAQHIALMPGYRYWLCAGGTRICFQRYG